MSKMVSDGTAKGHCIGSAGHAAWILHDCVDLRGNVREIGTGLDPSDNRTREIYPSTGRAVEAVGTAELRAAAGIEP